MSLLGEALVIQERFGEAEPLPTSIMELRLGSFPEVIALSS